MAINYNRDGIIGINLPSQNNNYQNVAFKPGSLKDKLINQLYNIEQNTGFSNPKLDQLKQEDMQQFQDKGTPLSLPSDAYTAMAISNYDDLFGPQTLTDALGTTRTLSGLDRPDINTAPFNVNEGVTNTNSFRNMLLDDLRNLPSDLRTSLGQTKDALVEDFSGLGSFLKDKSIQGFDFAKQIPGIAISAITGVPFLGQGLVSLFSSMKESPEEKAARDFYEKKYGLTNTGQVASGIMQGYNPVSLFGGPGLLNSIDKRLATILRTEKRKKDKNLELSQELINRRKELEDLRAQESAAASAFLESQRIGRRPGSGGNVDRITSGPGRNVDDTGQAYDTRGREGFGYGL
jgi:murein DD-endopeptidase MepM/ murein hydrolase activator NlpD